MRRFGLHASTVAVRLPAQNVAARVPPLAFCTGYGALSVGLVSLLAYSLWAFRLINGTASLYTAIAAVYIGLTGFALGRLVAPPRSRARFAALFAFAFFAYAALWCALWFGLRGKYLADLWGAVAGLAAMTLLLRGAFGEREGFAGFFHLFLALLAFHSIGYYLGELLYGTVRGTNGRLLWGAAHGLGFGAGLGYLLHRLQAAPLPPRRSA